MWFHTSRIKRNTTEQKRFRKSIESFWIVITFNMTNDMSGIKGGRNAFSVGNWVLWVRGSRVASQPWADDKTRWGFLEKLPN